MGIGNPLRRDDGVGWLLADRLAAQLRGDGVPVSVEHVQQLTPELAEVAAEWQVELIVFADAAAGRVAVELQQITGADAATHWVDSHACTPQLLLFLLAKLYGSRPAAWLMTIPAVDFAHGEGLSQSAAEALAGATTAIAALRGLWLGEERANPEEYPPFVAQPTPIWCA